MKNSQQLAAKAFSHKWEGRGYEKGESQPFWLELLEKVLEVEDSYSVISFENQVKLSNTSFIDAYIESTYTLIEQKSVDKDLRKPIPQSDGTLLTPFQQAKRYAAELPYSKRPRWVVISNFKSFHVYDMENPQGEPEVIELANLEKEYWRLAFLVDTGSLHLKKEMEVSLRAGEIIGEIYDELLKQYVDPESPATLRSLNVLCVRLVFCLYAEDSGLFGKHSMFHDYLSKFKPGEGDMRRALIDLFEVLDTPIGERSPYIHASLKPFPYCNGGLFSEKTIEIPYFNDRIAHLILKNASDDFDWSQISPTIFGAVFESTLNPVTRRSGGMHYTSIENIHKVIDPLFLDDLKEELETIKSEPSLKNRVKKASVYQNKLAGLKFLDPACGSGNFLTETYLSLRRLENEAIQIQCRGKGPSLGEAFTPIKVDIHQLYGIEINDFAVSVATTALWIAESQMMVETERIMQMDLDFLPLKSYHNIVEGNALRMDWGRLDIGAEPDYVYADRLNVIRPEDAPDLRGKVLEEPAGKYGELNVITTDVHFGVRENVSSPFHYDYIMGNPPFLGARFMSPSQKDDVISVFGKEWLNVGNLDYVACWYKKISDYTMGRATKAALVSTNSICQGESVYDLWKPLIESGIHINFAHRTFRWDSESKTKAHVHCVIVGFSRIDSVKKSIFSGDLRIEVNHINSYLIDGDDVFVESRQTPLCDVPEIGIGNKPIDGGNYLFTEEEMKEFIKKEPASQKWFKPFYGSQEFINRTPRYCLWLGDCPPNVLRSMPECLKRVEAVRKFRLASRSEGTQRLADRPTRFHVENMPDIDYIVIPETSSERRKYIPIGFMGPEVLCSNAVRIMPDAKLYHFGILTSNVHNAWMRSVGGRLKSDYRYSKDIVYNNFPWPSVDDLHRTKIEKTAQSILSARAKYSECSLADLYDEVTMPPELRKAHQENDKAVMDAYGFDWKKMTESECVSELLKMYAEMK